MEKPFFRGGLKFECTRCSKCCRFTPGYVFLSSRDLKNISRILGMSAESVQERYCRVVGINGFYRLSLKEKSNLDCIFWGDGGCSIYDGRPLQCQSYPFWSSNLADRETWEAVASSCPGIGRGPNHSADRISRWIRRRQNEPLIVINGSNKRCREILQGSS